MNTDVSRLRELDREITLLSHASAVLGWDQETYMPEKAVTERAEQLAALRGIIHAKTTDPEIGRLLDALSVSDERPSGAEKSDELDGQFLRTLGRRYRRATRLPSRLVTEIARRTSIAQSVWAQARKTDDFPLFAPHLEALIALSRETADLIGYADHPYDALLDEYEPWMTTATVRKVFDGLEPELKALTEKIMNAPAVDDAFLSRLYPVDLQERFGRLVLQDMSYEFTRGRLDVSAHPFTTTLGGDDVRLTTRYRERDFRTGIFGTIHEGGHGLYELGFDEQIKQSILADGTSLGIHESQSRFWENVIGRSLPFWRHYYPKLVELFPENLSTVSVENFHRAVNKVEPSLIRVEADEVTYSLHIILRFRIELELIGGGLSVKDLPEAWREESQKLLGVAPVNSADGVLQDIHWSMGAFGYFPTYALGNLYAAQFQAAMRKDIPDLDDALARGELAIPLAWLRDRIHRWGSRYTAGELCLRVTGEELDPGYFMRYLTQKYHSIYG